MAAAPAASILITGIGRRNAEKSAREFLGSAPPRVRRLTPRQPQKQTTGRRSQHAQGACAPELVLTCGFAGGLNPDLKLGDVVFEIFSSSSRRELAQTEIGNQLEPTYVGCYEQLAAAGAKPAKFFCADRIATTVAEKKKLRMETGADAVEMK